MKRFLIEWETDYCDNFPERSGECVIEADSEKEAAQEFYKNKIGKAFIVNITERT